MLTPDEFSAIYGAYCEERAARYRDDWERMRLLASITIQPHLKKRMKPQSLLRFPWDNRTTEARERHPQLSKEDALKRFEEVLKRVKG